MYLQLLLNNNNNNNNNVLTTCHMGNYVLQLVIHFWLIFVFIPKFQKIRLSSLNVLKNYFQYFRGKNCLP